MAKKGNKPKIKITDRPKPSAPRAGFKASGTRYGKGGKISGKKTV